MKGWKTVMFNGAVVLLPVVDQVQTLVQGAAPFLGPKAALALAFIGAANLVLRGITDSPIFRKS